MAGSDSLVLGAVSAYGFSGTPLSNITPFTYRDHATFQRVLFQLIDFLNEKHIPEINGIVYEAERLIRENNENSEAVYAAFLAEANTTISGWQTLFDEFMADVTAQIAILNDNAVASLVNAPASATGAAARTLINEIAISPDEVDVAVAAEILDDTSDTHTELTTFVDGRVSATADGVVSGLVAGPSTTNTAITALVTGATPTRDAVDARVSATADAVVGDLLDDPTSVVAGEVVQALNSRPLHADGTRTVQVGLVREPVSVARYSAFPSVTKLLDGRLFMVWYEATNHINARDGVIMCAYSSNQGKTWTAKTTLLSIPGLDLRDPTVSTSRDGKTLYFTYIRTTAAKPRDGFFLKKSTDNGATWTNAVRIDPDGSNGAGTAPILELSDGRLFATWFGMETGEAFDSTYYATSTDGGNTWSARTKLVDGVAAGRHYNEPFAAVQGNTLVILFRWGENDGIGRVQSSNNGTTWSAPVRAFDGSGRPSCLITTNGTLVVVYRNNESGTMTTMHGMMKTSRDLGSTWTQRKVVEYAIGGWWAYSWLVEVAPGMIYCPSAIELSATATEISGRYLIEGSGLSPFGDNPPSAEVRALERRTSLVAVDTFDRSDSGTVGRTENGIPWSTFHGQILDGALQNTGTGTVGMHVVNVRTPNMEIECEMSWSHTAGVWAVFWYVDDDNYWFAGTETGGTVFAIYRKLAGVTTQMETTPIVFTEAVYHRVRVATLGSVIRVNIEGVSIFSVVHTAAVKGQWAGVRTGVAGVPLAVHRVRNLLIHRRSGYAS